MDRMTRPAKAGNYMAKAIIEMVNLMYQNKTALHFLLELNNEIEHEIINRTKSGFVEGE